jgi:hypothetical protein
MKYTLCFSPKVYLLIHSTNGASLGNEDARSIRYSPDNPGTHCIKEKVDMQSK